MIETVRNHWCLPTALALLLFAHAASLPAARPPDLDQRIDALVADIQDKVADVPVISAADLLAAIAEGQAPVLLDVREPRERAVSIIPGAITDASAIAAGSSVVVYCTVGLRSGNTARELREHGYAAVNLRGGILAWLAAGGVVVDSQGEPTRRVHVYGQRWNAVPDDVTAVW